jgi:hypothetical protein
MTEKNTGAASRELGVMEGNGFYNSTPSRSAAPWRSGFRCWSTPSR